MVTHDFIFKSGEKLAELRMHYITLGTPARDAAGHVRNAVIIMHGTGGSGRAFLGAGFGGELFGKGQPLDAATHYIILPDAIGHGKTSKPSDGLHMKFPHYDYDDMVRADYLLLHDGLHVDHLRLVMGTSMGAMHTWVWGEMYPDFMDALMPLASAPVEIAGRNRMFRAMIMQAIQQRSGVEERRVHHAAGQRTDRRAIRAVDDDQQPAATAQGQPHARKSGCRGGRAAASAPGARCQRHAVPVRLLDRLQPVSPNSRRSRRRFTPSIPRTTKSIRRSWAFWSARSRRWRTDDTS